jgi:hypothetical protein
MKKGLRVSVHYSVHCSASEGRSQRSAFILPKFYVYVIVEPSEWSILNILFSGLTLQTRPKSGNTAGISESGNATKGPELNEDNFLFFSVLSLMSSL